MELSEAGIRQSVAVGRRLRREGLAAVHSSPQSRACATAAEIARQTGLPVEITPAIDEIDFGDWTGAPFDALARDPLWRQWNEVRGSCRPPNGEAMAEATARMVAHMEWIGRNLSEARVALVSHCDPIRGAVAYFRGLPVDGIFSFEIDPASITTLQIGPCGARVVALNEKVPDD